MFSYISVEQRASNDHPLRTIPLLVDGVLHQLGPRFDSIYAKSARPSIAPEQGRLDVTFATAVYNLVRTRNPGRARASHKKSLDGGKWS